MCMQAEIPDVVVVCSNGFGSNGNLWEGDPVPEGLKTRCDVAQEDNTIDAATFKVVLLSSLCVDWSLCACGWMEPV